MADEVKAVAAVAEVAPEVTVVDEPAKEGKKPDGHEQVPLGAAEQQRFNRLYRQVKAQDERLMHQGKHLETVTNSLIQTRQQLEATKGQDAIAALRGQIKEAREAGEEDKVDRLREQLGEVQAEVALSKKIAAVTPAKPQAKVAEAQPAVHLSPRDMAAIHKWSKETDAEGNYLRPYAAHEDHSQSEEAMLTLKELLQNEEDLTIGEILDQVDKKFGKAPKRQGQAQVASGDLTAAKVSEKPTLTRQQAEIAVKVFPNLAPAEARKKYYAGLQRAGKQE